MSWERIGDTDTLVPDTAYRCVMLLNIPYSEPSVAALKAACYVHAGLNRDIRIDGFDVLPPIWDPRAAKLSDRWSMAYRFHVNPAGSNVIEAGLDPWIVLAIAAAVVSVIVASGLLEKHLERLVETVGNELTGLIKTAGGYADDAGNVAIALGILALVFLVVLKH